MPFWRTYYHLVWSTHERQPLITELVERQLCDVLCEKAVELGIQVHALNTWRDHVHMVVTIPPRLSVAQVVGQLKGRSAHDLNHMGEHGLAWQRGYGVLTLGSRQVEAAVAYVRNQKQHHQDATVMAWLERAADDDEVPTGGPSDDRRVVREASSDYGPDRSEGGSWDEHEAPLDDT